MGREGCSGRTPLSRSGGSPVGWLPPGGQATTRIRFNSEWLDKLGTEGLIRLASRWTVARMLERVLAEDAKEIRGLQS